MPDMDKLRKTKDKRQKTKDKSKTQIYLDKPVRQACLPKARRQIDLFFAYCILKFMQLSF